MGGIKQVDEEQGAKFDEDPYEKVDLSLVPWSILSERYKDAPEKALAEKIHNLLNGKAQLLLSIIFRDATFSAGTTPLAIALGYGVAKYGRGNWKKGFGGDYKRFLKAALRHCDSYLLGEEYDGVTVGEYSKGNHHQGAILFNLMVAMFEEQK